MPEDGSWAAERNPHLQSTSGKCLRISALSQKPTSVSRHSKGSCAGQNGMAAWRGQCGGVTWGGGGEPGCRKAAGIRVQGLVTVTACWEAVVQTLPAEQSPS